MTTKIPNENKKHAVATNSDLFGTISYTKNINLDEEGYIKLSSRSVSLYSENDGTNTNLRVPTAFGRGNLFTGSVDYAITQSGQKGYWLTLLDSGNTLNVDVGTGVATLTTDSHGCWYQNLWHVTDATELYTKAGLGDSQTYTAKSASLTSGKVHFIEVFKNRNTLCITNGNGVKQLNSSYSAASIPQLTIPADFEAVAMQYSNNKMGIIAIPSDTTTGKNQNQEAYFFLWDGSTSDPEQGFPVGSDAIISLASYKGSWIILTRKGQIRFFTGGGWQDLVQLPFYYRKLIWGTSYTRTHLGDLMIVDGDKIYFNFNALFNAYGKNYEQYDQSHVGGIICYNPNIGIYNRYTPSISPVSILTVTSGNIDISTNIFTKTAGTIPTTGSPIKYISDKTSQIGGIKCPKIYYCIKLSSTTFALAETAELAGVGTKIDITSTGASNNYFMALQVYDFGQNYANQVGAIAELGEITPTHDHLIYGSELNDYNGTGNSVHLNITIPDFENRGYFVVSKITSGGIEDLQQKIYVKYKPLKTNDSIIVKCKKKESVGLPVSTPQSFSATTNQCIWTSDTSFYTTANLEDAKSAFDLGSELECEIIAGAGAGVMSKIATLTYGSGIYSITFDEVIPGAGSGRYSDVIIDRWQTLGTITSGNTDGFESFLIEGNSKDIKLKVELRGSETTIEELTLVNITNKKNE